MGVTGSKTKKIPLSVTRGKRQVGAAVGVGCGGALRTTLYNKMRRERVVARAG